MSGDAVTYKFTLTSDTYDGIFKIIAEDSIQAHNKILGILIKTQEESTNIDFKESNYIEFNNTDGIKIDTDGIKIDINDFCKINIKNVIDKKYEIDLLDVYNGCSNINCNCSDSIKAFSDKLICFRT
jgi:hypothetical protein